MKTSSIRVEGNIISPELFEKLDSADVRGQNPSDFGFDRSFKVKDDIARAWADAKDQWNIFKRRTEKLTDNQSGVEETRKFWIIPLLENLGYKLEFQRSSEVVNEKSYAISHRVEALDNFPIHIMGVNDNLDRRRESGGPRMSPHALLQEYVNVTEHLYGIVTNGFFLRILRDSGKLVRLSYLEFNLQRMLEDDLYAEFSIMYRLIHSSRMPKKQTEADQCIFEQYHQDAIESGSRIREKLSVAVEKSIKIIANGFLAHPASQTLRAEVIDGKLKPEDFFKQLLRFIYRILFLLVIEERDIVYPEIGKDLSQTEKDKLFYFKNIYYNYYSISRLRKLAEKIHFFDDKLDDLWISLNNTFNIFIEERYAKKLGIYPLGGDLFSPDAIGLLSQSQLDNKTLLECIRNLSLFESPNGKDVIRVNYAALNVEEFGSVYEGLLEYDGKFNIQNQQVTFEFVESSERSSSGSHYTPEELVQPLIKHSLDYVIEDKLTTAKLSFRTKRSGDPESISIEEREAKAQSLLSIKVCDVAAGSGHILLSAARRIAIELARVRTGEDQPSPEPYRHALRDVINHCIYGVDKNPLAVELCKVALWLEAYNPGLPLSFLDHKIKCGDSIVGLARREELEKGIANEAFKKMPGDDADVVKYITKKNKDESQGKENFFDTNEILDNIKKISTKYIEFDQLPEKTLEDVKNKAQQYDVLKGSDWWRLKQAADVQVAQFFLPKTKENQSKLTTFADYFRILGGEKSKHERQISEAMAIGVEKRFFHWFLEFPDVFAESGFDCILGNPPFLHGLKISENYGDEYNEYLVGVFMGGSKKTDLCAYFFRRNFQILNSKGVFALISTNTISQGTTRKGGLDVIESQGGTIYHASDSIKWPGKASVIISLVWISKTRWIKKNFLNNAEVIKISTLLKEAEENETSPNKLIRNDGKCFQGSNPYGEGFVIEPDTASVFLSNEKNQDVVYPFIGGKELNNRTINEHERWIINFDEKDFDDASTYSDVFQYVEGTVKPERMTRDKEKYPRLVDEWWKFWHSRHELYDNLRTTNVQRVLGRSRISNIHMIDFLNKDFVYSESLIIFLFEDNFTFGLLQSSIHQYWAEKYASTMKTDTRYIVSDCFETFPIPKSSSRETEVELEKIGEQYHEFRRQLMLNLQLGLTKTYNLFHNAECRVQNLEVAKNIREFKQAKLQIPIEQAVKEIETLRILHKEMDEAVLKAYDWGFGSAQPINLAHNYYEVDYLPENDRIRYTISPEARKEILKRLLELNHKIHEEEVAAGLWDKKGKKKEKVEIPKPKDEGQANLF
ncbi:MAG: hypothetical protein NTX65_14980 [Ignavibacteriales bacterium]|nr:hypothetical protein [Ignavibacteriales bacterium]